MAAVVVADVLRDTTTISHNLFCIVSIIGIGSINTQYVHVPIFQWETLWSHEIRDNMLSSSPRRVVLIN